LPNNNQHKLSNIVVLPVALSPYMEASLPSNSKFINLIPLKLFNVIALNFIVSP